MFNRIVGRSVDDKPTEASCRRYLVAVACLPQEYDYHLSAVNTITFVDEGRRFVSTSDDKTIRVWELGIPVQVSPPSPPRALVSAPPPTWLAAGLCRTCLPSVF